jgi:ribosome-associated translation inhibitor RaiA
MQITFHADSNTGGGQPMADHVTTVVTQALERFGERITSVEAHLTGVGSRGGSGAADIECALEARLAGHEPVVVKEHAGNAHQAIEGAARKLKRAVGTALAKHDPRGHQARAAQSAAEAGADLPD